MRRERALELAAVGGPALVALGLCLYQLDSRSLWLDESASFAIASQHGAAFGSALARDGGNMLGYYALLHVLVGAFGGGVTVLRLPSAFGAAAAAGLTGALARRLWDRRMAALSGTLAAVSLTLVYWGQNARGYALMTAFIAASWLALLWLVGPPRASRRRWAAYVIASVAAVYMGLPALLILPAQLTALIWYRHAARRLLSALLVVAACCLPLGVLAAQRGSSQLFWVPAPSLRTAKQLLDALASSGLQPGYYVATGNALLILTGLLVGLAVWRTAARLRRRVADGRSQPLVMIWLVAPPALALVFSLAGHSIFQARYALVSLPAVAVVLAAALARGQLPAMLALAGVAALLALRALALAPSYGVSSELWSTATTYVAAHTQPADCIGFYPEDGRMPFQYYAGRGRMLPRPVLPTLPWGIVRPYVEVYAGLAPARLAMVARGCRRLWLVWSHEGHLGGPPGSAANFRRLRVLRRRLATHYPQGSTRVFGRASPISVELFRGAA